MKQHNLRTMISFHPIASGHEESPIYINHAFRASSGCSTDLYSIELKELESYS